jgi:hypothetical protein
MQTAKITKIEFINPARNIYIPVGAQKGDCQVGNCKGVLYLSSYKSAELGIEEVYVCDSCNEIYVEGVNDLVSWREFCTVPARRYFAAVKF